MQLNQAQKNKVDELLKSNHDFKKIHEEHHRLDIQLEKMATQHLADDALNQLKRKKLQLKDQIFSYLK